MDLLASLTFGLVIATNIREMGVTEPGPLTRAISRAGVFAGVLMALIYCGLAYVGVSASEVAAGATNGAAVLTASATQHFGIAGTVVVAAIFLLACLNVCTGLISCCGTYFSNEIPGVSYRACAFVFAAFSCFLSNFGLDAILAFSVPLLGAMYPVAIVLVLMGMFHAACDERPDYLAARCGCHGGHQRHRGVARRLRSRRDASHRCSSVCRPWAKLGRSCSPCRTRRFLLWPYRYQEGICPLVFYRRVVRACDKIRYATSYFSVVSASGQKRSQQSPIGRKRSQQPNADGEGSLASVPPHRSCR